MSVARRTKTRVLAPCTSIDLSDLFPVEPEHRAALRNSAFHQHRLVQLRSLERKAGRLRESSTFAETASALDWLYYFEKSLGKAVAHSNSLPLLRPHEFFDNHDVSEVQVQEMEQAQQLASQVSFDRPQTFSDIMKANTIRQRPEETIRLSGGLLGPYQYSHLQNLSSFIAYHHELLRAPSLTAEHMAAKYSDSLVCCLSYRHKLTAREHDRDRMSHIEYENWFQIARIMYNNTRRTLFFWQDQKAKGVRTDSELDWIANGIMPYMMCPAVILVSERGKEDDGTRLWLSVERMLAANTHGFVAIENRNVVEQTQIMGITDILEAERRFAAMVLYGMFEGKETFHEPDRQMMIRWAVSKLVHINRQSESTFGNIKNEANISCNEMTRLCGQVFRNLFVTEGTTVEIKVRMGRSHTGWADLISVFETQQGSVAGGISVRGTESAKIFAGEYSIISNGRDCYYVRVECAEGTGMILTGKLTLENSENYEKGCVTQGMKIVTREVIKCLERFAIRLLHLGEVGDATESAMFYVNGRRQLLDEIARRVVERVWQVSGESVYVLSENRLQWN